MNRAGAKRRISAWGLSIAVLCACVTAEAWEATPDKKSGIRSESILAGSPLKAIRSRIGPESPRGRRGRGSTAHARTDTVSLPLARYRGEETVPAKSILPPSKAGSTWIRTYDGLGDEAAFAIAQTDDGGYILVGSVWAGSDEDIYAVKIDANGDEEWSNTYGDSGDNNGLDVIQTSDGGYGIAGANYYDPDGYYASHLQFYKLLPNGDLDYGRYGNMYDWQEARALLQTPDGGYALAGAVWSDVEPQDMLLMVLDSDGWLVDYEIYGTPRNDMAHSLVRLPDGSYAVAGYGELYGTSQFDALLLMIAPDWDLTWWRVFGGPQSDWASSLIRTSDGGFAMCGGTRDHTTDKREVFFVKTDSDGYEEWSRTYWDSSDTEGYGVVEALDGRFVVGGYTAPFGWGDMVIMKLEEPARKADYVWRHTYGGPDWDVGYDLTGTSDGGFALAGYTQSYNWTGGYDAMVVKTDASGMADTGQVSPTADFTGTPRVGTYPLTVQFTDQSDPGSEPITGWMWAFGDGSYSHAQNPSHTFTDPGGAKQINPTYTVSLMATTDVGSDVTTKVGYITISDNPLLPLASFTASPRSGKAPLTVQFTDTSDPVGSPLTNWVWVFRDGTVVNGEQHPEHTYTDPGTYTVTLSVFNAAGSDSESQLEYITVEETPILPTASYMAIPTSGAAPLLVDFTHNSDPGTSDIASLHWDFGDGATSTELGPTHTYATGGAYTTALTVRTAVGSDTLVKHEYIGVANFSEPPTADFVASVTAGEAPLSVQFTDRSDAGSHAITSWQWNFGDGGTSTAQNPTHTYSSQGSRTVSLTVTSEAGSDGETKADYVSVVVGGTPNVEGRVVDVDLDWGLDGVLVELFNADSGASLGSTTTAIGGSFSVTAPNRTTELRLRFSKDGYDTKQLAGLTAPATLNVHLEKSVPKAPTGLAGHAGAEGVSLSWNGNTEADIAGYYVYRDTTDKFLIRVAAGLVDGTDYVDTTAERGEEYYYYVTAVDEDGNESGLSNEITVLHGVVIAWLPNVSGQAGDQLRVPISLENAAGVEARGIDIWLRYDADVIDFGVAEPVRVERTAVTSHVDFESDVSEPGSADISTRVENDALVGEGQVFNVFFILKSTLAPGNCGALEFGKVTLYDAQSMPIAVDFSDTGLICAKPECQHGDLNGDGAVNADDVSVALRISVGLEQARGCQPFAGDLNGDHIIDSADALLIQRIADGLPLNPPQPGDKALHLCENALKSILVGKQATTLSIGVVSADPGQTVSVPVSLSNAAGLTGYNLVLAFPKDNALVALQSVNTGTLTSGFHKEVRPGEGFVEIAMGASQAITASQGTIAVLTFEVAKTAPDGTALPVVVSEVELDGQYGDRFAWYTSVTKQNGVVYVGESPSENGDVDGSGDVNAVDVQLVINEALALTTGYDCDINEDGDVNAVDVQLVINAALGLL